MQKYWSLNDFPENLVPFQAGALKTAMIWSSSILEDEDDMLQECSFSIDALRSGQQQKTFFAERYGGTGIVHNGGGARCGFDGRYQVKGIGANPLVGIGTDRHHSNGALAEEHAVYESIWAEILALILPYGAVRSLAVLRTEEYIDIAFERDTRRARKALLIREPVLRPAHFERAAYFKPQAGIVEKTLHDYDRVKIAIRKLPYLLPVPSEVFFDLGYQGQEARCAEGLVELAVRQARQMAFCRSRMILLTTSPSNIAMDGKLLDFNGVFCLSPIDSVQDFEFRLKHRHLIMEPQHLLRGLHDLCIYAGKHLFSKTYSDHLQSVINEVFNQELELETAKQQFALLGMNVTSIDTAVGKSVLISVATNVTRLISNIHRDYGVQSGMLIRKVIYAITSEVSPLNHYCAKEDIGVQELNIEMRASIDNSVCAIRTAGFSGDLTVHIPFKHPLEIKAYIDLTFGSRRDLQKDFMLEEINCLLSSHADSRDLAASLRQLTERKIISARRAFQGAPSESIC